MADAGFTDVQMATVTKKMALTSAEDVWTIATSGAPPIMALLERAGDAGREKVRQALVEIVQAKWPNPAGQHRHRGNRDAALTRNGEGTGSPRQGWGVLRAGAPFCLIRSHPGASI